MTLRASERTKNAKKSIKDNGSEYSTKGKSKVSPYLPAILNSEDLGPWEHCSVPNKGKIVRSVNWVLRISIFTEK